MMKAGALVLRVLLVSLVLGLVYSLGWAVLRAETVLRAVGLACGAAYLVNPVVRRLQSRGMARSMAIAAVFLALFSALAVGFSMLAPVVQQQVQQVGQQVQRFMASSDAHVARLEVVLRERLPAGMMEGRDLKAIVDSRVQSIAAQLVGLVTSLLLAVGSNLAYVFLLPMMTFLVLQDGPRFFAYLIGSTPNRYFEAGQRLMQRIDEQLGGYARGVLVVSFCVGVVDTVGLWVCGLNYFFVLGPLMGLMNVVPIFGSLAGIALAALAMLLQTGEPISMLGPVLVGVTAQVLDNVAFTPIAVSRSVDLHPLLVLVATLMGGELFGLLGLLLAVPFLATIKVIWQAVAETRTSHRLAAREEHAAQGPQEAVS
jgi:predicted PurR-regulated permease PerM